MKDHIIKTGSMTDFRQLLPIKYFIFIISLHLLLKGVKQEVSQTTSVERFALQVVTGKQKKHHLC